MIELKNIEIGYSESILSVHDMTLESGKMYVLVGKNGSGKSTFLKTLSKQIRPQSGTILLNQRELESRTSSALPELLAFVPVQFPHMDYVRTCEYIATGRAPYTNVLGKLAQKDYEVVAEAIQLLEIGALEHRFTSELSDGEKQLVSIAKAVAQETPIILLDEPTAFLDYSNKKKVLHFLRETAIQLNKCIVLSAHDLDLCLEFTPDFLVIDESTHTLKVVEAPTKSELIRMAFASDTN
jgi:iron complex transport system ATP-binding protein